MSWSVELADNISLSSWSVITPIDKSQPVMLGGQAGGTEVGTGSGFNLDDDAGTMALPGRRPIRATETATASPTTLFRGRVGPKGIGRGTRFDGSAKMFDVALDDANVDLYGIIVDGWDRPAETDYARVIALRDAFLHGASSSSLRKRTSTDLATTWVINASTVSLPAQKYNDTSPAGVLQDICQMSGKDCFVTVDMELAYFSPTYTGYASGLSITDSSPNLTTSFPPIWGGNAADEDPSEFLSGLKVKYGADEASWVSDSRGSVAALFDKWETVIFADTTSSVKATAIMTATLDNQGKEEKRRQFAIEIPANLVDQIKYGQTISYRAAASGDLTPVTLRIARLLWEPPPARDDAPTAYTAHLELEKPLKMIPRVPKGSNPSLGSGTGTPPGNTDCCPPFDGIGTPDPGQPVLNELIAMGDGTTTAFTTAYPYAPLSLRVWVDNINVAVSLTETNPATGAFTLDFPPLTGERIVASYNGHA